MMNRFKNLRIALAFALLSAFAVTAGCESSAPAPDEKAGAVEPEKGAAKEAPAEAGGEMAKEATPKGNFTIETKGEELTAGGEGKVEVVIKPAAGFKINKEFPWKVAELSGNDVVAAKEAELGKDAWNLDDKQATLAIPVEARKAGEGELAGKVTFSVCNDSACDVYRDQAINWKVAAK